MSIALPAGFGIVGTNIKHEPARTIVFATFGESLSRPELSLGLGNPIGAASGSLLGGGMASIGAGAWQYLFYLLAGIVTLLGVASYFIIPPDRPNPTADRRIDWLGGALVTAGVFLFTFSLTESGHAVNSWRTPCEC